MIMRTAPMHNLVERDVVDLTVLFILVVLIVNDVKARNFYKYIVFERANNGQVRVVRRTPWEKLLGVFALFALEYNMGRLLRCLEPDTFVTRSA